ncbi:MAG: hypothetical protein KGP28_07970 [Bdellovibrionales bacterium]|nr:hypothetical protein [Bdellovibrionales bacterium]
MSFRYWLRYKHENEPLGLAFFYPGVLQSGDGNGILPMEFPVLNLLFSPLWAFGPYWGKVLTYLTFSVFVFYMIWQVSKKNSLVGAGMLLIPTLSYSADYIEKFLPDTFAMILLLFGCFQLNKKRLLGLTLVTFGLLAKPTAIVGLSILFFFSGFRKRILEFISYLVFPIMITILFYTYGISWIRQKTIGTTNLFAVEFRDPIRSFTEILFDHDFLLNQFFHRFIMAFGVLILALLITQKKKILKFKTLALFIFLTLLSFWSIAALDGKHLTQHDYYLMSASPLICGFIYILLRNSRRWASLFALTIISIHSFELSIQNLSLSSVRQFWERTQECRTLIQRNPEFPFRSGYVFRSNAEPFPSLGLCFGEREGSLRAHFGFFYKSRLKEIPFGCSVVDQTKSYVLAKCENENEP